MEKDEIKKTCTEFFSCVERINRSSEGFIGFQRYLEIHASKTEQFGIKRSSILGDTADHFNYIKKWLEKGIELKEETKDEIDFYDEKAKRFCKWAGLYLKSIEGGFEVGQKFYLYFMYFDRAGVEPQLGRAILTIDDLGKATCNNLSTGKTYSGPFSLLTGHYAFDLRSGDKVTLHLKVGYFIPEKDEIFLGAYMTFEDEHIVTGGIVLEKCNESEAVPIEMSWFRHPEEYKKVHKSIKRFLSIKKHCYQKIPSKINSKSNLNRFLNQYIEDWMNRFFELEKPTMFVALHNNLSHTDAVTNEIEHITKKVVAIKETYENRIKVEYFDGNSSSPDGESDSVLKSLKSLTRTRLFVIILNDTDKHSFALVQLGWAISHCKRVIVLYKEGCVSEMFKKLVFINPENKKVKISLYPFKNIETFNDCFVNVETEMEKCLKLPKVVKVEEDDDDD